MQVSRSNLIKAHPKLECGVGEFDSGNLSLCKCASIHVALLQVNMGILTPHYIKQLSYFKVLPYNGSGWQLAELICLF